MRFIHAADIHLDSPLVGLSAYQDAPAALLRTATREAFANLVQHAIDEQVDFLVIAGDLYDGSWKDFNTGLFFVAQMGRLQRARIPVFVLFGNHDAESEMTRKLAMPDNVVCFDARRAATHTLEPLKVALHGRSFKDAATTDNLVLHYPPPKAGWFNIGVLHTALESNGSVHARYAPCTVAELEAKGYDYWALGHVHEHQVWRERCPIVFPGNLQGRSIREVGPRGAVLVSVDDGRVTDIERLHVDVLRWHALDVDVSAATGLTDAVTLAGNSLRMLLEGAGHRLPFALRVTLAGATPAHGALFGLESQLRAEILGQAAALGGERLWIEKVRLDTRPDEPSSVIAARADALADLQAFLDRADQDDDFLGGLRSDLQTMIGKLPIEVVESVPALAAIRAGDLRPLVRETVPSLLAHIARAV